MFPADILLAYLATVLVVKAAGLSILALGRQR